VAQATSKAGHHPGHGGGGHVVVHVASGGLQPHVAHAHQQKREQHHHAHTLCQQKAQALLAHQHVQRGKRHSQGGITPKVYGAGDALQQLKRAYQQHTATDQRKDPQRRLAPDEGEGHS
jgi:hypothetical protein